jgi:hypothetical protein
MSAALLALVLAAQVPPLKPQLPGPPERGDEGSVVQVRADGAFLDRGAADGLAVGARLRLLRKGRAAAGCTVTHLADHGAFCSGEGLQPSDTFKFSAPDEKAPKRLPPLPTELELSRQAAALERFGAPLVEYAAARPSRPAAVRARLLEVAYRHTTWTTAGAPDSAFHLEALDIAVRGFQPHRDWRLSLDLGVRLYSGRPAAFRDPVVSPIRLHVREAEVEWDGPSLAWRLAAGRVWARNVPGLAALDGVQGAWKAAPGLEVGAFAGLLPEALTAGISTERWTAGAWQSFEWRGTGAVKLFREAVRAAAVGRPEPRGEVELFAQASFEHPLDIEAAARVGFGDGPFMLDAARLAVGWRPHSSVHLQVSGRYTGRLLYEVVTPLAPATGVPALHLDGGAGWEPLSGLIIAARAGFARDFDAQLSRFYAGPELALPRLFGGLGGVRATWLEETGHQGRRAVWLTADLELFELARLWTRLSWTQQTPTEGTGAFAAHEVGAQFAVDFQLPMGFGLTASAQVRHGVGGAGDADLRPTGTTAWVLQAGASWGW